MQTTTHHSWNIKSRSLKCTESGREFADGEHFYTALFEDPESDGFIRRDYSEEAWRKLSEPVGAFSFWRSTFEPPPPPEEEVVKKENAESLLRRLIEEDNRSTENARYILAVMLERKKILKQIDTKTVRRRRLLIYERHKTGEAFVVVDPQLKLEEIETVQEEVSSLLGGDSPQNTQSGETSPNLTPDTTAPAAKRHANTGAQRPTPQSPPKAG